MENNDRFWRKGAEVWIDEVILDEKSFFFIYDKLSDIEMDDLFFCLTLEKAIEYCENNNLNWEITPDIEVE